ncbi:MAG: UDP-glucose 4-epimerase GalE, partial [Phaeodactylibacter sp.]|nr:UDP-glucose 4-epimerase GalE [Phaeodactylibacter sp.]
MQKILVTGGCGYIGSHTIIDLLDNGFEVVSVDNLVNSSDAVLEAVRVITGKVVRNYPIDLCDWEKVQGLFQAEGSIQGVIHFAALKSVGESEESPLLYYHNNLNSLLNILRAVQDYEVPYFIFSSSCSVYGNSEDLPVRENTPVQEAESTYASTKQMGERIIRDFMKVYPQGAAIALRYFNPAGAHESALLGEAPTNRASNLVPVITETAIGKRAEVVVFGDDYDTRDGSCVRDYIHIMDLASAHTKAFQYLFGQKNTANYEVFNLGIGAGVSVLEAIHAFEEATGAALNYRIG